MRISARHSFQQLLRRVRGHGEARMSSALLLVLGLVALWWAVNTRQS